MRQAGVTIMSGMAALVEMLHDHTSPIAGEIYGALDLPATRYILGLFAQRPKKVHFGGNTGLASGSSLPYLPDILGVMG